MITRDKNSFLFGCLIGFCAGLALGLTLTSEIIVSRVVAEPVEQKVQTMLGSLMLQNANLASQVEELRERLARAETKVCTDDKPQERK